MRICNVVGARPNFMKIAPVSEALARRGIDQLLVHTGQHYDHNMSQVFFDELGLPRPDIYLGIGSDSHTRQTARIMTAFEEICQTHTPDLVVVCGDVNSTIATALVAAKLNIPVAHVEAGLRSFDRTMPEEINRVLTDHLSDLLFTTEHSGDENLAREGIDPARVHFVGNCMVDTLLKHVETARAQAPWAGYNLEPDGYALLTLHRPSNVDDRETFTGLIEAINTVAKSLPVLFPVHPRTRARIADWGVQPAPGLRLVDPQPYLTFIGLMSQARLVLTDSGGIQEETTALGVPCLTLRWNTERPITVEQGTNQLIGTDAVRLAEAAQTILAGKWKQGQVPPLWDGKAGERIGTVISEWAAAR
ncbi:MAG: non-hydrolyzing UDP-N-acetylglucosamine 2-epimerase [Chloroflexota bacterium]